MVIEIKKFFIVFEGKFIFLIVFERCFYYYGFFNWILVVICNVIFNCFIIDRDIGVIFKVVLFFSVWYRIRYVFNSFKWCYNGRFGGYIISWVKFGCIFYSFFFVSDFNDWIKFFYGVCVIYDSFKRLSVYWI